MCLLLGFKCYCEYVRECCQDGTCYQLFVTMMFTPNQGVSRPLILGARLLLSPWKILLWMLQNETLSVLTPPLPHSPEVAVGTLLGRYFKDDAKTSYLTHFIIALFSFVHIRMEKKIAVEKWLQKKKSMGICLKLYDAMFC